MNTLIFTIQIFSIALAILFAAVRGKPYLIALMALFGILANLFVTKEIILYGMRVTASDALAVGDMLLVSVIQILYGEKAAKQAIYVGFFNMVVFALLGQLHLALVPSSFDTTQGAFQTILATSPRIVMASIICYFISKRLDIYLFSFLKRRLQTEGLGMTLASAFSHVIDTALFTFLALYGVASHLLDVFTLSICIKIICLIWMVIPLRFMMNIMVKEGYIEV